MITKLLKEAGHEEALLGMALSYYDHATPIDEWWDDEKKARAAKRADSLAHKNGGHSKFLESIQVWLYIQAPRCFWSEFDTYRVGITKQSSSTMHTLSKRSTTIKDYEKGTSYDSMIAFNRVLASDSDITELKMSLPEGWLQERIVCTNYKTLQNIIAQRHKHRLKQWPEFCHAVLAQVNHPKYLWQD